MADLNVAYQTHLPHNPVESHGLHLRMDGNLTKMKATTLVRSQPNARSGPYRPRRHRLSPGEFECKQYFRETANLRHIHHELEEAGEIEGEPDSGTRRESITIGGCNRDVGRPGCGRDVTH